MRSVKLAIVVLTYNEELNLPDCLASLKALDAHVTVVDSGSTDNTVTIAKNWGATVISHPFENYAKQRNWAQENLSVKPDWIFHIDADERLTPELARDIANVVTDPPDGIVAFMTSRREIFFDKWIKHGGLYPTYHMRLFKFGHGHCENRLYDQHFVAHGPSRKLSGDLIDVLTSDLTTWTTRHARWAEAEARQLTQHHDGGEVEPKLFGSPIERRRWLRHKLYERMPLFVRPALYFGYRYIGRGGFLDGREGFVYHVLQGAWFRFLVDSHVMLERTKAARAKKSGSGT
ncbi:MAG: glycosyltransferase family 2 protein [Clostridia bacterium]|nr:glycosyltransferase family 2 protein [Deltaproteobacteria bacterium]